MSGADTPQGPGWWQASDGKWYAPEQASATPPPIPPAPSQPMTPTPAGNTGESGQAGFFGRLFDVSMKSFITPSIIKVLFVIGIIAITLFALFALAAGAANDGARILILLAPLYWFIGVLYLRVILEVIVVLFRIEENTRHRR
jgi:hypothetical protein